LLYAVPLLVAPEPKENRHADAWVAVTNIADEGRLKLNAAGASVIPEKLMLHAHPDGSGPELSVASSDTDVSDQAWNDVMTESGR
jgi:hypothetical protein